MSSLLFLASDLSGNAVYPPWQFSQAMAQAGHSTLLAGPRSGALWAPLAHELQAAVVLPGRWAGLPGAHHARELARATRAGAVYPFKALPTSYGVALRIRDAIGIPLIVHLDDWDAGFFSEVPALRRAVRGLRSLGHPEGDVWLRLLERAVTRADAVTVSTSALQRRFGGTVVRQGLDLQRYAPEVFPRTVARDRLGVGPDDPMVLFLGTPRAHKGLGGLAGLERLASALWMVGAAPAQLADAGVPADLLEGIHVRGPVPFDEAGWYLGACDVFVVPQSATPFARHQLPAKLVQAMALGCAVVATDVGDAGALLGGTPAAGLVVPPDDPEELRAAIERLLADAELRAALGGEARRRAEAHLGWDAMARSVERVLGEVGLDG